MRCSARVGEIVRLIYDDDIPTRLLQCPQDTFLLGKVDRSDDMVAIVPGIRPGGQAREQFPGQVIVVQYLEREAELVAHLVGPLILQGSRHDNQYTVAAPASDQVRCDQASIYG